MSVVSFVTKMYVPEDGPPGRPRVSADGRVAPWDDCVATDPAQPARSAATTNAPNRVFIGPPKAVHMGRLIQSRIYPEVVRPIGTSQLVYCQNPTNEKTVPHPDPLQFLPTPP